MSDDLPPIPALTPEEEDEALAAELALGLLDGDEAQQAVARLAGDPVLAQRVRDWQERLAAMTDELTPVMPPARARQRIRERLGHAVPPLSTVPDSRIRWWQRPMALFGAVVAVLALALVLIVPMMGPDSGPGDMPQYRADLVAEQPALRVAATLSGRELDFVLHDGPAAAGRDWEIWWVKPDGSAPVSLGVLPRSGERRVTLPQGLDMADGVQIALSDEPEGGSPTGQATGPVVAIAPLTAS